MLFLLASILFSSSLLIFFKLFEKFKIKAQQAIAVNYIVASVVGFYFLTPGYQINSKDTSWLIVACGLGAMFTIIFNLSRFSTQKVGMGITSMAMKLGVIFPVLVGLICYDEVFKPLNYCGLALGFGSIFLLNNRNTSATDQHLPKYLMFLPILVWIGSGICDSGVQLAYKRFPQVGQNGTFAFMTFWSAGCISLLFLLFRGASWDFKSILGGILLGIPNYFSIYFLFACLDSLENLFQLKSSTVFMINNLAIVVLSILIGVILFKEKLSQINCIGVLLALIALFLISFK